ncbi:N-succinylarginine dihydrolase [Sneathiella glossodoripedis]|uniref:N-succinylarginine dihydrolase n=1 Tax=Sneathiella glossodoripedis TaxID=418853 RepID=UPI00046E58FD|nr:N-succinylarginine dihydrolase [Sneathiella glossodoripedis]
MPQEYNVDGLVGPTHNFSGLSFGNIASFKNAADISNPREAALQGLEKMKTLSSMGYLQAVLPPQERPHIPTLKKLGFSGSDEQILKTVMQQDPSLLATVSSASAMWVANAATVSPSADTTDHKTHFTPANLVAMPHRSIETATTKRILQSIFSAPHLFEHHDPLPSISQFGDEGAANHTRFYNTDNAAGVELFVYGTPELDSHAHTIQPRKFPARQTLRASQAVARLHKLNSNTAVFAQQNPDAIDSGVFHNDVIAVGNRNCLFFHEEAFLNTSKLMDDLRTRIPSITLVKVPSTAVPLKDAITSYLFNTQLVNLNEEKGTMCLIAPMECMENTNVKSYLDELIQQETPIQDVQFINVRQSMKNGGGPACLRLRVPLTDEEKQSINANVFLTDALYSNLKAWIQRHYRDKLSFTDLGDPELLKECRTALDELTNILKLGSVYDFQLS